MVDQGNRPRGGQLEQGPGEERQFYVYYLRRPDKPDPLDPEKGQPFYVGKGKKGTRRKLNHRREAKKLLNKPGRKPYKISIIHSLWKQGLDFEEDIYLDGLTEQEAFDLEIEAIEVYGRHNNDTGILANMTDGGDGVSGLIHTNDSKEKMRRANLGKHPSQETKEKLSRALKGRKQKPEVIEKNRQSRLGKKNSPESNEKNRQAHLGRKHKPESIEKIRQGNLGKKRGPETIERIRRATSGNTNWKGKKHKPESIEKIRQAKLGEKNPNWKGGRGKDV